MAIAPTFGDYYYCSVTKSCTTLCNAMDCSKPGFPVLHYLRVCSNSSPLSSWCCLTISFSVALFSFCLQFFPASGSFPMSHLHTRCQNYWSFSFSISPFDEYLGLISFRIDWFDLPAVQVALRSLLQHHSSKVSIPQHSASFMTTSLSINIPSSSLSERQIWNLFCLPTWLPCE